MSLFQRLAWTGFGLLVAIALLAVLVWRPASAEAFVQRTEGLLRNAEGDARSLATDLVEETMSFATRAARAAEEKRARAVGDLPFSLYIDADGRLLPEQLRRGLLQVVSDPGATGGEKHAAVRAELLERTRRRVDERLAHLRAVRGAAAARHGSLVAQRTLAAWGGLLLVLLAGWAIALHRIVVRPVCSLTATVARFGAGDRSVRIRPGGAAELVELARAFNASAEAVERTERENEELRSGLETKVRERTAALVRAARASTAGTMAGGVAHEFNNLLGGILGCADSALEEAPPAPVAEALAMIRKTARRGVGVTQALLRATRAEPELAACDPAELFEEALAEVRPPSGIEIHRRFEPVTLEADGAMLRQVLANLLRNAVGAMGGRGTLELGIEDGPDEVRLVVGDSGPGIEPAVREVLFEPFVTTRQGGREGAGLGLFLADRLAGAHGGRIAVESEPGAGARFTVHLPRGRSARDS